MLRALLGPTRARTLAATAAGCTTTEIARWANVSTASASYHASILRNAGLIRTQRRGAAVRHTITALGAALLVGGSDETECLSQENEDSAARTAR